MKGVDNMLGCFVTLLFLLIAIIIIFVIVAFPVALLVGLGVALIWLLVWLLINHTIWGIILLIVIIAFEFI